jgi:hypothetical protein
MAIAPAELDVPPTAVEPPKPAEPPAESGGVELSVPLQATDVNNAPAIQKIVDLWVRDLMQSLHGRFAHSSETAQRKPAPT